MHVGDHVRASQAEDVEIACEIAGMVSEPLAPEVGLFEVKCLQHGSEGPVEQQDALLELVLQPSASLGRTGRGGAHARTPAIGETVSPVGAAAGVRSPRYQQIA